MRTNSVSLDQRHPDLAQLIDPNIELEVVADGFDFTEGPIWHPGEAALIFSDIMGNSLYRWNEGDGLRKIRRNSYLANGNAFDHQGRVVTCEHGTSRLTRSTLIGPSATDPLTNEGLEILATHHNGMQLNSPNDVVVKRDGTIYFTDPGSGRSPVHGIPREREMDYCGVYRLDPTSDELTLLTDEITWPNGLCFSRDESQLFVNDSRSLNIWRYDVQPDGTLTNGMIWAETIGDGPGVPDGMKIDVQGNIWCCAQGGVHIFSSQPPSQPSPSQGEGVLLGIIQTPEQAANLVFGDADYRTLYITATTSVYRLRVHVAGHPTYSG